MNNAFAVAAKISTMWSLVAFAIAAIIYLANRKASGTVRLALGAIVLLTLVAVAGSFYVEQRDKIYVVRTIVLGLEKSPVDNAKVWSSQGGEPKKVDGGWQFDIPTASVSKDKKLTVYAKVESAFLIGQSEIILDSDFRPALTVQLTHPEVRIRGVVVDEKGHAVEGASVQVLGYESEMIKTKAGGGFDLPSHAADGQQVQLHAEKAGLTEQAWYPAGAPVEIVLRH